MDRRKCVVGEVTAPLHAVGNRSQDNKFIRIIQGIIYTVVIISLITKHPAAPAQQSTCHYCTLSNRPSGRILNPNLSRKNDAVSVDGIYDDDDDVEDGCVVGPPDLLYRH